MKTDPFAIKKYPLWHPLRLAFTAKAKAIEWEAKLNFKNYSLPKKLIVNLPPAPELDYANTAVTPLQMQHLLYALLVTEHLTDTVIVEIGACRGVTTKFLASNTQRQVIAVDPFMGYGGSSEDYRIFQDNTADLPNVIHERLTSGAAIKNWRHGAASLVFIDAVHDYVNTAFDIESWSSLIVHGGILALHDTDEYRFAGTRKAVFEACKTRESFAHPLNLTLLLT